MVSYTYKPTKHLRLEMLLGGSGRKKEKEKGRKLGNSKKGKRKEGWVKNFELGDKRNVCKR